MKTSSAFLLLCALIATFGCKEKKPEETPESFVGESYVMVDDDVEFYIKTRGALYLQKEISTSRR